jgi:acyl-CoA thioesterase
MSPQQLAEAVRDVMWADDRASRSLGMFVVAVGPGTATSVMTVREDMLNGHDICHGGLVAMLADSTFAYACNAYNEITVASGFDVSLIAAAHLGDELTAQCVEVAKAGRTGVYDITVTNQRGERIAVFRGRSYTMKGKPVIEGLPMGKPNSSVAQQQKN